MTIDELDRFQNDLDVVLQANAPLEWNANLRALPSRSKRRADLRRYQQLLRASHESSDLKDLPTAIPVRFQAALRTYGTTGSMSAVLDGLAVRGLAREQLRRVIRWPLLYLSLLFLMAAGGLYFYWQHVLPEINFFRRDLNSQLTLGKSLNPVLPTWYFSLIGLAVLSMLLLLCGGFFRLMLWMGGNRYLNAMSAATAQRIVPLLVQGGMGGEQAVLISYELCGLNCQQHAKYLPELRSANPQAWLLGSDYWLLIADLQLIRLKFLFPVLMVSLIGGLTALIYGIAIYGPVIAMLQQMPVPGS